MRVGAFPTVPFRRDWKIVVVGPCASGKTTLVRGLRRLGYDAHVCGQEHSEIASLWRHTAPDLVIALDVDLTTIRDRRGADWPEEIYRLQQRRLAAARAAAALILDTSILSPDEMLEAVERRLREAQLASD